MDDLRAAAIEVFMTLTVNIGEAKARLSELIARVEAGEEVVIARGHVPAVKLAPLDEEAERLALMRQAFAVRDSGEILPVTHEESSPGAARADNSV